MEYKLILAQVSGETLETDVEYQFPDATKMLVRVSHFMPADDAEVIRNIQQRGESEWVKRQATIRNEQIAQVLQYEIDASGDKA